MSASKPSKVIIGMSGGVDSSVAALLLLQQGYRVEGLFMKNWDEDDGTEYCTAQADFDDALAVSQRLGIELHSANFAAEYWDGVFEHFLREYRAGRTPNPDVLCNREIKFKVFVDYARTLGADAIATGHYARARMNDESFELHKAIDGNKDQTYFLNAVPQDELARCLFPIGDLMKSEVRAYAKRAGLHNHQRKDSTGICFIGERRFRDFLSRYVSAAPGLIAGMDGRVLGEHTGLAYYTIGQRQGLGIGGRPGRLEAPWYVVAKDLRANRLTVSQDVTDLSSDWLTTPSVNWLMPAPPFPYRCAARIRYRQADQGCTLQRSADGGLWVDFDKPQRAVTPGQYVCFYSDTRCLGGGMIERNGRRRRRSPNA